MNNEQANCLACGRTFADALSYCAHKPWAGRVRGKCRIPRAMYEGPDGWTLRPAAREEAQIAEDEPYREKSPVFQKTPSGD